MHHTTFIPHYYKITTQPLRSHNPTTTITPQSHDHLNTTPPPPHHHPTTTTTPPYLHYLPQANSVAACERACQIEYEFLCRSFLYKGPPSPNNYNCQLFHLDHYTFPDGEATFASTDRLGLVRLGKVKQSNWYL